MKAAKVEVPVVEFKIWCEQCCIRIAPNEERTVIGGKIYHSNCYSKLFPASSKQTKVKG
jgi:hypothetical protein